MSSGLTIKSNPLILPGSFSRGLSATAYGVVRNKIYVVPLHHLIPIKTVLKTRKRIDYNIDLNQLLNQLHIRNNKIVLYEFAFSNSRNPSVTKYIVDLRHQNKEYVVVEDHHGLLPYFMNSMLGPLKNINTLAGLWIRLLAYGPGMLEVIRQAARNILNIGLLVNARTLGSIICGGLINLRTYVLASYITYSYNQNSPRRSLHRILQGLHEVYVLMLLGISHYQCSGQKHNIKTIMHQYLDGRYYWLLYAMYRRPTAIIQTPSGNYYTIWYQFPLPGLKAPDIMVFKGKYEDIKSLYEMNNIDEIILIDAKIRYKASDHKRLLSYINELKRRFNPKRLMVVLPFLEDLASSVSARVNPYELENVVSNGNLYVVEDVRPGGAGDLEFMKIMYRLMP